VGVYVKHDVSTDARELHVRRILEEQRAVRQFVHAVGYHFAQYKRARIERIDDEQHFRLNRGIIVSGRCYLIVHCIELAVDTVGMVDMVEHTLHIRMRQAGGVDMKVMVIL
jgi:hypothetical protein